jgi:hypothetical protein
VSDELERFAEVSSRLTLERLCDRGFLGRHGRAMLTTITAGACLVDVPHRGQGKISATSMSKFKRGRVGIAQWYRNPRECPMRLPPRDPFAGHGCTRVAGGS